MIRNERQYRITKAQAERFAAALKELSSQPSGSSTTEYVHPILLKAQRDALQSQYDELRQEIADYEALQNGTQPILEANSWHALPETLIRARIAQGLSQKDLADRIGVKEQQIQKYESSGFSGASFERLGEIIAALGVHIREEIFLPAAGVSMATLVKQLRSLGFERDFIHQRLLVDTQTNNGNGDSGALVAAGRVGRIFGWTPVDIFSSTLLTPNREALGLARLKVNARANVVRTTAYAVYAHYLCLLLLQSTRHLEPRAIPSTGVEAHAEIMAEFGVVTFETALRYVWGKGIPVLPLNDSGAFYGACWRIGGRNILCLKQATSFLARWLDDLLHEFGHASQNPEESEFGIIEEDNPLENRKDSPEEKAAVRYASDATLGGQAEPLSQKCVEAAKGSVERLKRVVPMVAEQSGVSADVLANYMAYRLSLQGIKWWPTATTLQPTGQNPWRIARDVLLEFADFSSLAEPDRELMRCALSGE